MMQPFDELLAQAYGDLARGDTAQAVKLLLRLLRQWPKHAGAHVLLGIALERQYQPQAAAAAYAEALALMPGLLEPALRLSGLLEDFEQQNAAAQLLHRAADSARGNPEAQLVHAIAFAMDGRHLDAECELRALLAVQPAKSEAWRLLGNTLAIDGRIDEARDALRRAFALDPDNSAILHDLVRHVTIGDQDRPVIQRIERLIADHQITPHQRVRLNFALGKCLDDLGDYENALRAFDAGNAIRIRLRPFDRNEWQTQVDRQIATFSQATLAQYARHAATGRRAIFIVGMPRSGTTLTEQILSSHPDVAAGGEMLFWGKRAPAWHDIDPSNADAFLAQIAADQAKELDAISNTALRVTDKNPLNFTWLGLIHMALPNAIIVHCRRNPIDTCLSCFMTPFSGGNSFAASRTDLVFFYRQYERLMAHWRSVLPAQRFVELDYEELVSNQEAVTRQLIAFCELPWHPDCLAPERNRRPVLTASVMQARRPVYASSVARWRRYEPWLGELRELM